MNKITKEFLLSEISEVKYVRISETMTHCTIIVHSGFQFTGESSCVDPKNFDETIGKEIAYQNAFNSMWQPYGFWLKQVMYNNDTSIKSSLSLFNIIKTIVPD